MRGYLTNIIERQMRRLALGAVFGLGVGSIGIVATQDAGADHPTLMGAELAAARAQILLTDVCGERMAEPSGACEKRLEKALDLLARVRATITEAATTAAGS